MDKGGNKVNIPKTVTIGGVEYRVVIEPASKLDKKNDGSIDYSGQTIDLESCSGPDYTKRIFLHECIHGMMYALGMHSGSHNEELVDGLSHQLYQLIKDNPEMFTQ